MESRIPSTFINYITSCGYNFDELSFISTRIFELLDEGYLKEADLESLTQKDYETIMETRFDTPYIEDYANFNISQADEGTYCLLTNNRVLYFVEE